MAMPPRAAGTGRRPWHPTGTAGWPGRSPSAGAALSAAGVPGVVVAAAVAAMAVARGGGGVETLEAHRREHVRLGRVVVRAEVLQAE